MSDFKCEYCNSFQTSKGNLDKHKKKSVECVKIQMSKGLNVELPVTKCEFCDKEYGKTNIKKHQETCSKKIPLLSINNSNNNVIHIHIEEKIEKNMVEYDESNEQHIYCLIEREFIKTKETIYKIGKSTKLFKRLEHYPKGSRVIAFAKVNDCNKAEEELLASLDKEVKRAPEIGREYYNCNLPDLLRIFHTVAINNI